MRRSPVRVRVSALFFLTHKQEEKANQKRTYCGISTSVVHQLPKLRRRVRLPYSALSTPFSFSIIAPFAWRLLHICIQRQTSRNTLSIPLFTEEHSRIHQPQTTRSTLAMLLFAKHHPHTQQPQTTRSALAMPLFAKHQPHAPDRLENSAPKHQTWYQKTLSPTLF